MTVRVVADDQTLVRAGFRLLVDSTPTVPGNHISNESWALQEDVHPWMTLGVASGGTGGCHLWVDVRVARWR
jgi:hypothetical protein